MKFKEFLNETPMMGDDRIKKSDSDAQKWLDAITKESIARIESGVDFDDDIDPKKEHFLYDFRFLESYEFGQFKCDEFNKYQWGRVVSIKSDDKLIAVIKYDHTNDYFTIEMINKGVGVSSKMVLDAVLALAKHKNKIGLKSDHIQTTGGRNMWKNIIAYADDNGLEYGYYNKKVKNKWDGSLKDFMKFANEELYDTVDKKDRSKFAYILYIMFK